MEIDPTRMCELLVGLPDVEVRGVDAVGPGWLVVAVAVRDRFVVHRAPRGRAGGPEADDEGGSVGN